MKFSSLLLWSSGLANCILQLGLWVNTQQAHFLITFFFIIIMLVNYFSLYWLSLFGQINLFFILVSPSYI